MPQSSCSREMRWALFFVGLASGPPPSALQLPLCACWPGAASWFEGIHCPPLPPDLLPGTVVRSRHAWLERSLHCLLLLQIDIRVCQLHPFHNFALHLNTCGRFRSVFTSCRSRSGCTSCGTRASSASPSRCAAVADLFDFAAPFWFGAGSKLQA